MKEIQQLAQNSFNSCKWQLLKLTDVIVVSVSIERRTWYIFQLPGDITHVKIEVST